jgi:hypothetical protein
LHLGTRGHVAQFVAQFQEKAASAIVKAFGATLPANAAM